MTLVLAAAGDVGTAAAFRANIRRVAARTDASAAEILRMLDEVRARLRDRLAGGGEGSSMWARAMLREVQAEMERLASRMDATMSRHFLDAMQQADRDVLDVAQLAANGRWLGMAGVSGDLIDFASQDSADLVRQITTGLRGQLNRTLRTASTGAVPIENVARALGDTIRTADRDPSIFGKVATQVERVLRTETGRLYEGAAAARVDRVVSDSGLSAEVGWITTLDGRERDSHRALNGTWIKYGEKFDVGGHPADGPLDPALPPEEAVNCRCTAGYRFEEAA